MKRFEKKRPEKRIFNKNVEKTKKEKKEKRKNGNGKNFFSLDSRKNKNVIFCTFTQKLKECQYLENIISA